MHTGPIIAAVDLSRPQIDLPADVAVWVDYLGDVGYVRTRKVAEMLDDGHLLGVVHRRPYPWDATALCGVGRDHDAPDPDCSCGFYALRDHQRSPYRTRTAGRRSLVEIEVILSGTAVFHETEHGLLVRAARQHVLSVVSPAAVATPADVSLPRLRRLGPDGGVGAIVDLAGPLPPPRDAAAALAVPLERTSSWLTGPGSVSAAGSRPGRLLRPAASPAEFMR